MRRKWDVLIVAGVALLTSYWVFDLVADAYGSRYGRFRILLDIGLFLAQLGVLAIVLHAQKERRRLEAALIIESQQAAVDKARTEAILSALNDCVSIQDREYRVLYQNESHKRLTRGEHLGKVCYQAFSGQDTICAGCPVEKTFADGLPHWQEKPLAESQGERHIEIVTSPLRERDGQLLAVIEMVRDVTHRKTSELQIRQLNQQLQTKAEELQAANQELEAFNYSLSHDLRSPLAQIETALELLAFNLEAGDAQNEHNPFFLQTIRQGSERIDQMIHGMLELARIGREEISRSRIDLGEFALEVYGALQQRDPQRLVKLVIAPDLIVFSDKTLLRIVVQNLLENAWKYTAYTEAPYIEFGQCEQAGRKVFFVRDNGAGFNPALSKRLFLPFQRLHDVKVFPGDGIGLSTVQRIIQRHGGSIWAEGAVGKGATFYFTLGADEV